MTATIDHKPPETPDGLPVSRPRPGFTNPCSATAIALGLTAEGMPADYLRQLAVPGDQVYAEIITEMGRLALEGLTPQDCREILWAAECGLGPEFAPAA